jgi:hypothetical protein
MLQEALWTSMPNEWWHTGIDPKLFIGSWNLCDALQVRTANLDFFVMTSSVSGSVGTAAEVNYSAANYFLDLLRSSCAAKPCRACPSAWA